MVGDSDDDDFGPAPLTAAVDAQQPEPDPSSSSDKQQPPKKRRRLLDHEHLYVEALPDSSAYEKSYMHRDVVTHIAVAQATDFVVTGSVDGHVKLWKKMPAGLEFVKHFVAHIGRLHSLVVSPDGLKLCTSAADRMVKIFDVQSFDMANMILTEKATQISPSEGFVPGQLCWLVEGQSKIYSRVAVADLNSGAIRIYRIEEAGSEYGEVSLHAAPVLCLATNLLHGVVVSADCRGMIEYWDAESLATPSYKQGVLFQRKMETDLYAIAKVVMTAAHS
jgi:peptidylprolyl isomerase domain and WD repeat-containing protein 1